MASSDPWRAFFRSTPVSSLIDQEPPDDLWGNGCPCQGQWSLARHFRWNFMVCYDGIHRSIETSTGAFLSAAWDHTAATLERLLGSGNTRG